MKKDKATEIVSFVIGTYAGLIIGVLIAWYPLRIWHCAVYDSYDCGEVFLLLWPFYCVVAPILGGIIARLLYRRLSG